MSTEEGTRGGQGCREAADLPLERTIKLLRWIRWSFVFFGITLFAYEMSQHVWPGHVGYLGEWADILVAAVAVPILVFFGTRWAEGQARESRRANAALHQLYQASSQSLDVGDVLQSGLDVSVSMLRMDGGAIFVLEEDGKALALRAHRGIPEEALRDLRQWKIHDRAGARAVAEKKPVLTDVRAHSEDVLPPSLRQAGIATLVSVPLLSAGKVVGLLSLGTRRSQGLSPDDLQLLESIGVQLGTALHNALLYDGLQKQLEERNRAEAQARREKRFSESLLQSLGSGVFAVDSSGKLIIVNRAFVEMTGFGEQELLGQMPPFKYWADEDIPRIMEMYQDLKVNGRGTWELLFKRKNGDRFNVLVNAGRFDDASGGRILLGTVVDVTGRMRAEEQLRTTNQTLEALVQGSPVAIIVHDAQRRVALWNPAAERMFGWRAEEVMGLPNPIIPSELAGEAEGRFTQVTRGEGPPDIETRRLRKDGSHIDVRMSTAPLRAADGAVMGSIALLMDISEHKQAEEALERRTLEREALLDIATTFAQQLPFREKVSRVLEQLRRIAQADFVLLGVPNTRDHTLVILGSSPVSAEALRPSSIPDSMGVAGRAFHQGRMVVANDYGAHPAALPETAGQGARSVVSMPVKAGGTILGIITAWSKERDHFTPERLRILGGVADGMGALLDSARLQDMLNAQIAQAQARLAALQDAAAKLALEEDPRNAKQNLVSTACDLAGARYGALALWDEDGKIAVWHHNSPSSREAPSMAGPTPDGLGLLVRIRDEQKSVRLADIAGHLHPGGLPPGHPPIGSFLGVPIRCRPGLRGALYLGEAKDGTEFSEGDERLLNLFAILAGGFLENSRLYADMARERRTLEAIQASMTEGLGVFDSDGRMIYYNPAAASYTGVPAEMVVGKPGNEIKDVLTRFIDPPAAGQMLLRAVQEGIDKPQDIKITITNPTQGNPTTRHLNVEIFPILGEPGSPMVGFLARDITRELELEQRRDQFVAIASHELRTPMTMILGFSELLLKREPSPEQQRQWVGRINADCQKLVTIVDDMLNVSRIQSGKIRIERVPLDIASIVQEAVGDVQPAADKHEVLARIPADIPRVAADRGKLGQVLRNLLTNAVKYSPLGGPITVSARHERERGRVVISVADQGIGIAPEDQATLFMTFHRIRRPETENVGGSGLGLYIVKGFVELMQGEIWLESEMNKGSTFYFALPCAGQEDSEGNGG